MVPYLPANCTSERPPHLEPVGMEAAVERFRLKRADVLVASDRKTSSSPRAQSQVVPAGTSHPRFSWHANTQLPRERDKSSRAASSKTAEQNCRLHCRQNRRRPAPCRPPGPPLGQRGKRRETLLTGKPDFVTTTTPRTRRNGSSRREVRAEARRCSRRVR